MACGISQAHIEYVFQRALAYPTTAITVAGANYRAGSGLNQAMYMHPRQYCLTCNYTTVGKDVAHTNLNDNMLIMSWASPWLPFSSEYWNFKENNIDFSTPHE